MLGRTVRVPTIIGVKDLSILRSEAVEHGVTYAHEAGLRVALHPRVLQEVRSGAAWASRVLLHELGHAILHADVLTGIRAPHHGVESEAELFAELIMRSVTKSP